MPPTLGGAVHKEPEAIMSWPSRDVYADFGINGRLNGVYFNFLYEPFTVSNQTGHAERSAGACPQDGRSCQTVKLQLQGIACGQGSDPGGG